MTTPEPWCGYSSPYLGRCACGDPANHEPGGRYYMAGRSPDGWEAARQAIQRGAKPTVVVSILRLLLPCQVCGAAPMQPCKRALGAVGHTHAARGEE